MAYIKSLIDNDSFSELLLNNNKQVYSRSMKHGLERYFQILKKYIRTGDSTVPDIVTAAITGQVLSKFGIVVNEEHFHNRNVIEKKGDLLQLTKREVESRVTLLFQETNFGGRSIKVNSKDFEFSEEIFPLAIPRVMFDVVLTELILNIKMNYPREFDDFKEFIKIRMTKTKWVFLNRTLISPRVKHSHDILQYHGLHMIQEILRDLGYDALEIKFNQEKREFALTINTPIND